MVNGCAVLTILVGTPLAGLAFELPGEGAVAFAVIGALVATSLFALPRARLRHPPTLPTMPSPSWPLRTERLGLEWQSELVYAILAREWRDASGGGDSGDGRY